MQHLAFIHKAMGVSMVVPYNPIDCYWFVAGDITQVWSSARMMYVPVGDDNYQQWLASGLNTTSTNPAAGDLSAVMQEQALPLYFGAGITIVSDSTPAINSTYGLDPTTLDQIGTVARDSAAGFGLPLGAESFQYPDMDGNIRSLSEPNVQNLYKAMRNYVAATTYAIKTRVMGGAADLPSSTVPIP